MRYVLLFCALGMSSVLAAWLEAEHSGRVGWRVGVVAYLGAGFLAIGVLYGLAWSGHPVGGAFWGWGPLRVLLVPYQGLAWVVLVMGAAVGRGPARSVVAPGWVIGRYPFPWEREALAREEVTAVLDLCAELPGWSGLSRDRRFVVRSVPLLDGVPPPDGGFREAVDWALARRSEGRTVLIHCAQGHGRSALVMAGALCRAGVAGGADEALALVRAVRPGARPSRAQREALRRLVADRARPG